MSHARQAEPQPRRTRLTLSEYPGDAVRILCRACRRDRQHDLARLIALFGPGAELGQVLARLTDCGRQRDWRADGPCWAEFTPATALLARPAAAPLGRPVPAVPAPPAHHPR